MTFLSVLSFCVFLFSAGVIIRFMILGKMFEGPGPIDERQELINTTIAAAGIVLAAVIMAWFRGIAMLIAFVPGLLGILWGETVYYGWERLQRLKEEERYREFE